VEEVSWNDVQEFLQKLNEQTGRHYQLPTEAQWNMPPGAENSAEAICCGSNEMPSVAWWGQKHRNLSCWPENNQMNWVFMICLELFWEWCSDWFADYDMISQTNPQGPLSGLPGCPGCSGRHENVLPRSIRATMFLRMSARMELGSGCTGSLDKNMKNRLT